MQAELDEILEAFEHSTHEDVDTLLADYKKGTELIAQLEEYLKTAEVTLKKYKK